MYSVDWSKLWSFLEIKNEYVLAKWSYHCYLPKFSSTAQVIVWYVGGISAAPCINMLYSFLDKIRFNIILLINAVE